MNNANLPRPTNIDEALNAAAAWTFRVVVKTERFAIVDGSGLRVLFFIIGKSVRFIQMDFAYDTTWMDHQLAAAMRVAQKSGAVIHDNEISLLCNPIHSA